MKQQFKPINKPYLFGVVAQRDDGIEVEAVRCYEGEWDLFLTRSGQVVACSVDAYRKWGHGNASKAEVMQVARTLVS